MKLLDRVGLLIRSTFGSLLHSKPADRLEGALARRDDRWPDKARAHLEILRQYLVGAERRGNRELAERLRREIDELQRLLDKAQAHRRTNSQEAAQPHQAMTGADVLDKASDGAFDDTRIADQIRKMRGRE